MKERRDWHLLKFAHKAVHEPTWPSYIKLETVSHSRLLRSSNARALRMTLEAGPFQDSASKLFIPLRGDLRNCADYFLKILKHNC